MLPFFFNIHNFITKFFYKTKCNILKNPKFTIDTNSYEFAVLPYTSQEIKETIKYLETFNIQSLKNLTVVAPQKGTTCIFKKVLSLPRVLSAVQQSLRFLY